MTIRYAVIGSGMMGQEHIRNLALIEGAEVTALADPDETMLAGAGDLVEGSFGVKPKYYADCQSLLTAGGIDAIVIATPNHTHQEVLDYCLTANFPILCEKPLATTPAVAFDIAKRAEARTAPFWVAMEYRYMPPVAAMIDCIKAGVIGRKIRLSIIEHRHPFLDKTENWNRFSHSSGGTMVEKCCHFFDLMRLIADSEPARLMASGDQDVSYKNERYAGETPDIIDNAYVIVEFKNGLRASLDLCMFAEGSYFQEVISVIGDTAKIEAKVPGPARFWPGHAERNAYLELSPRAEKKPVRTAITVDEKVLRAGDHHGSTYFQHVLFFKLLKDGGRPEVTARDGAIAVQMGAAAEEAIRTGRIIDF